MTGTGYYGHVAITAGSVRGMVYDDPVLEVQLRIRADGLAPGVAAMILTSCHAQGGASPAVIGRAEAIITPLGFAPHEGGDKPYATSEYARWHLTPTAVEHLERIRGGGDLILYITPTVVLLNHREPIQDVYDRQEGVLRPNVSPHSPDTACGAGTSRYPG